VADVLGERPGLERRRHTQFPRQRLAAPAVHGDGGTRLAAGVEAPHQRALGRLSEGVVGHRVAGEVDRPHEVAGGLHARGARLQRRDEPAEDVVARRHRPLVVQIREKRMGAEGRRRAQRRRVAGRQQPFELFQVDEARQVRIEADAQAVTRQVTAATDARHAGTHGPQGASQRPTGTRVEHVGPEESRQPGTGLEAGVHEQVRQERPGAGPGELRHPATVDPDGEPAE